MQKLSDQEWWLLIPWKCVSAIQIISFAVWRQHLPRFKGIVSDKWGFMQNVHYRYLSVPFSALPFMCDWQLKKCIFLLAPTYLRIKSYPQAIPPVHCRLPVLSACLCLFHAPLIIWPPIANHTPGLRLKLLVTPFPNFSRLYLKHFCILLD